MFQVEIAARKREQTGKGAMRRLRMDGMTPGVVYGGGREALQLAMETKTLTAKLLEYARRNTVVMLKIDDSQEKSVHIGEIQTDPVRDTLVHVDFCEVDLNQTRTYTVPLVYKGLAKGVDLGGDMVINVREVVLEGKPLDIPDECVIDVTPLGMGDSVSCGEVRIPDNVRLVTSGAIVAVSVVKPAVVASAGKDDEKKKKKK